MTWRVHIFGLFIVNAVLSSVFELFLAPLIKPFVGMLAQKHYTDTTYGRGGLPAEGCKRYHVIRRQFEDQWVAPEVPVREGGKLPVHGLGDKDTASGSAPSYGSLSSSASTAKGADKPSWSLLGAIFGRSRRTHGSLNDAEAAPLLNSQ